MSDPNLAPVDLIREVRDYVMGFPMMDLGSRDAVEAIAAFIWNRERLKDAALPIPPGVIAILLAPDGREIAHVADFAPDRPGGCTAREAQTWRATAALAREVFHAMCNGDLAGALSELYEHQRNEILSNLKKRGYRVTIVPVGHGEEET